MFVGLWLGHGKASFIRTEWEIFILFHQVNAQQS
jgi:hypothetical protein